MPYLIDEKNLERQQLLGRVLNPLTLSLLEDLGVPADARVLDIACGLGETAVMLTGLLDEEGEYVGIDQDARLLEFARGRDWGPKRVFFQEADAVALPFDDRSFDLVFTRYLLVHLSEPVAVLREMLRLLRPGGLAVAVEPDFGFSAAYPPSAAYERIAGVAQTAFPHALMGRQLPLAFREAGASAPEERAMIAVETGSGAMKAVYRMSFEAFGPALVESGHLDRVDYEAMLAEFARVEADPNVTVLGNPVVAVWQRG